jgi:8-oxo-dGTP pyrophosphatase MutT (NUDIX family)
MTKSSRSHSSQDWSSGRLVSLETRLRLSLDREHPYPFRLPLEGRPASVLALFGLSEVDPVAGPKLLLTERRSDLPHHPGQVALPGGIRDPEDRDSHHTALRETEEEVGIVPESVRLLGALPILNTFVTGFLVTPVVGVLTLPLEKVLLRPEPGEIARVDWVSWSSLLDPSAYRLEPIPDRDWKTDVFDVSDFRVWGATGAMLRNLVERWRLVDSEPGTR